MVIIVTNTYYFLRVAYGLVLVQTNAHAGTLGTGSRVIVQ